MDNVNKPKHYTSGKIEVIDYIKDKLTPEQYKGYLLGNVIKYTSRFQLKNGLEDLEKGRVYLDWLAKVEAGEGKGETDDIAPKVVAGDRIINVDGTPFRNGEMIATVESVDDSGRIRLEHGKYIPPRHYDRFIKLPTPTWKSPLMKKSISQLCKEAYENAKEKGWHDEKRSFGDVIALIHSELSEALEDHRNGRGYLETWYEGTGSDHKTKPCGIPSELADVCIRIFDFCGEHGIDLEGMITEKMAYNKLRTNRHGGKTL